MILLLQRLQIYVQLGLILSVREFKMDVFGLNRGFVVAILYFLEEPAVLDLFHRILLEDVPVFSLIVVCYLSSACYYAEMS